MDELLPAGLADSRENEMTSIVVKARPGEKIRLSKIDPDDTGGLKKEKAVERFLALKEKISAFQEKLYAEHCRSLLIIFQALDTGGKDGATKNLAWGINPAGVRITPFKIPTGDELDHDFLWRAHKAVPEKGLIGIWNRSHYEDVLVVRVHKLVEKRVWKARYCQINDFERILSENGATVLKFMLHISKDEQKRRLQSRLETAEKQWKFNPDDLKERALWKEYERAYEAAINCCTTEDAPWYVVPANHKWARNLAVAEVVLRALKKMDPQFPRVTFVPNAITID